MFTLLEDQKCYANKVDRLVWLPCNKFIFTSKFVLSRLTFGGVDFFWHHDVWEQLVPIKIKVFLWKIDMKRLSTRSHLHKIHLWCVLW